MTIYTYSIPPAVLPLDVVTARDRFILTYPKRGSHGKYIINCNCYVDGIGRFDYINKFKSGT